MNVIIVTPFGQPANVYGVVIVPDHLTAQETFEAACREQGDDPAKFEFRENIAVPLDSTEPQSFSVRNTRVDLPPTLASDLDAIGAENVGRIQ